MSSLTPRARDLVQAGREALRPSPEDRERVALALAPQLGAAVVGEVATTLPANAAAAKATVVKILVGLVGAGVVGGALVLAWRSGVPSGVSPAAVPAQPSIAALETWAQPAPVVSAPPAAAESAEATPTDDAPTPAASAARRAPSARTSTDAPPATDSLAQEVAILSRASSALHGGRPAVALTLLAEHQRKFPQGALTQERAAARIRALCALGRSTEARAALARLSSNSPLKARARQACGFTPEE